MLNGRSRESLGKMRHPITEREGVEAKPSNWVGDPYECMIMVSDKHVLNVIF